MKEGLVVKWGSGGVGSFGWVPVGASGCSSLYRVLAEVWAG
jgi:hypothetical protein